MNNPYLVLILTYNNNHDLLECIESLERQDKTNFDVKIINNDGYGHNWEYIEKKHTFVEVIHLDSNYGVAGGFNKAIKRHVAKYDWFILLSDDLLFPNNFLGSINSSLSVFPQPSLIGCLNLKYSDNSKWISSSISYISMENRYLEHRPSEKNWDIDTKNIENMVISSKIFPLPEYKPVNDFYLSDRIVGSVMIIHKEVFNRVGLFNPNYFMYYEEVDYCIRCRQNSIPVFYTEKFYVYHKIGQSSDNEFKTYYRVRNFNYIGYKVFTGFEKLKFLISNSRRFLFFNIKRAAGDRKIVIAALQGYVDFFKGKIGPR